jgi:membrane protease YdiL (CAAX protease family)
VRPAALASIAIAIAVTGTASYFAFLPQSAGNVAFWVFSVGPTLVLGACAAAWGRRQEFLREWLAPKWGDFTRGVGGAVLLFSLAWAFTRLAAPIGSKHEIWLVSLYGEIGDPRMLQAHAPAIAAAISAAAIAEEVLWRGAITQLLAERVGSRTAWLWAAGLYALAYLPTAWSLRAMGPGAGLNPLLPMAALAGGLVWGAMARAFGRLAPSILAHALFDWAAVMMFPLWGMR